VHGRSLMSVNADRANLPRTILLMLCVFAFHYPSRPSGSRSGRCGGHGARILGAE